MKPHLLISRRTALRGLGVSVALPWLECMVPDRAAAPAPAGKSPLRMAFIYVPNGKDMANWTPKQLGSNFELSPILQPLAPFKQDLLVLSGLTLDKARANGDGPGDHARAMSAFLTGRQPRKTHGADIRAGVSADQLAAQKIGHLTRFPSLELGIEKGLNAGNCDSGYSCAYSANLSWRSESTPQAKEVDPRAVFERLFGVPGKEGSAASAKRERQRKSILDFVAEDAGDLRKKLGGADQRKLDEYLGGIREIEQRLTKAQPVADIGQSKIARPTGIPGQVADHMKIMCDMLALAFQGDLTRVASFAFANDGSNRPYKFIEVPEGHHDLSHHGRNQAKLEKIKKINTFHVSMLAYLLGKLRDVKEGDRSLLDNVMLVYGSGIGDGDAHNHDDLPVLVAGRGAGTLKTGRHLRFPKETPLMNLYLAMLDRVGVNVPSFGDSTGRLTGLEG